MQSMHHIAMSADSASSATILALVLASFLYLRGWRRLQENPVNPILGWQLTSFLLGMFLVWGALASPLVGYDHELLTVHMIQHLLLMTFAPPLILMSEPLLAFWRGLPRLGRVALGPLFRLRFVQQFGRMISRPALCWTVSTLTLMGWHVPSVFTLGMHSEVWHTVEQATFLAAGFLFWWPVVQAWPSDSIGPKWSTILYLFLATLPCDILSGFLVFSDRVAYPLFFTVPRRFGFSVLQDQQCAAALMWTCITVVYLVPAAVISTKLLGPQTTNRHGLIPSRPDAAGSRIDSQSLGVV